MNIANSIIALIAPSQAGSHRPADPIALAPSSTVRPGDARSETEQVWDSGKHCPELDGLRGIAILLVTLYRCTKEIDPSLSTGFAWIRRVNEFGERGVDLFFVLSGFLITGILLKTKSRPHYFRNFIVRRALRIFPLYYLSLAIFLFVIPSVIATQSFELPRSNQFYLWTYTSNVYMSWTNAWSFGPLDHFWSLAVEEHFYLIWPAVVFFLSPKDFFASPWPRPLGSVCFAWSVP
jgi:peptidoglycan/LPS O-acetylase OafA/YrhL